MPYNGKQGLLNTFWIETSSLDQEKQKFCSRLVFNFIKNINKIKITIITQFYITKICISQMTTCLD